MVADNLVFIFPGQGSHSVGMGRDLYDNSAIAKKFFETADKITGLGISKLCFEGPEDKLGQTNFTQPAIFTVSAILKELLNEKGINPKLALGHSLGEYSALYAAGCFDFETGIKLVAKRGDIMAKAGIKRPGGMAAIVGLDDEKVKEVCAAAVSIGVVQPANFNCPGQVVISGEKSAVEKAVQLATEAGAQNAVILKVSGAFHSELMKDAKDEFDAFLAGMNFKSNNIQVVANVTADYIRNDKEIPGLLSRQLYSPVRWTESILGLAKDGYKKFIEVGPGNVLRGLLRRIDKSLEVSSVNSLASLSSMLDKT